MGLQTMIENYGYAAILIGAAGGRLNLSQKVDDLLHLPAIQVPKPYRGEAGSFSNI